MSTYENLALVALRLDSCYRGGPGGCKSEVRAVFRAVSTDPVGDTFATDGAVHVSYDVLLASTVEAIVRDIQEARGPGPLPEEKLGVHPVLAAQGLGGPFATRLLSSLSRHIGEHRISRITTYDHTLGANGHEWSFRIMDRVRGQMTPVVVPTTLDLLQTVTGSSAHAALEDSFAHLVGAASTKDPVASVVGAARPAPGSPEALSLAKSFDAALRGENPGIHNAATTDCANCHLAEGAHRIGTSVYGFKVNNGSRFDPSVPHRDERTSVTNLHSFGYLKGETCISQRTANEATAAAQSLFRGGGGPRRPLTEHMRGGA